MARLGAGGVRGVRLDKVSNETGELKLFDLMFGRDLLRADMAPEFGWPARPYLTCKLNIRRFPLNSDLCASGRSSWAAAPIVLGVAGLQLISKRAADRG